MLHQHEYSDHFEDSIEPVSLTDEQIHVVGQLTLQEDLIERVELEGLKDSVDPPEPSKGGHSAQLPMTLLGQELEGEDTD
jgi:hypothetical protein